jgi:predicted metal-dependent hydrolase
VPAPRTSSRHSFRHGQHTICFELVRSDRRTLGLSVQRDGSVVARAPRRAREADVLAWVSGHADWILRRQRTAAERALATPPRRFVDGETHLYLGREYRLTIVGGSGGGAAGGGGMRGADSGVRDAAERVRLGNGELLVAVNGNASPERVASLLDTWYTRQARRRLPERVDACWAAFPSAGRPKPVVRVKRMRSRWGSMSPKGAMSLRADLIRAPVECIDYVIVHELCHLVHPHHGREFWALVETLVPDWKQRRRRLELLPD